MDDLWKRGVAAYIGLSIAIIGIAAGMESNGSASLRNPVWQLVSSLRSVFIYSWVLLVSLIAIVLLIEFIFSCRERERKRIEAIKQEEELERKKVIWAEEDKTRQLKNKEAEHKRRLEQARLKKQNDLRLETLERERKARNSEEAAKAALKDFL